MQISNFMDSYLSKQQCGVRKSYRTQFCLLVMLEQWKNAVDKRKSFGALLMDLSKVFDCLSYGLLIAKLHVYGFNLPALKLIQSYLSNRKQRTKLMRRIAHGTKFYLEYHKYLFSVLYHLIFFCVICFG